MYRLDATKKQAEYARLRGAEGLSKVDAARIAYPDAKNPNVSASQAESSPVVRRLIVQHTLKKIKMEASGESFNLLMQAVKNKVVIDVDADGNDVFEHVKVAERIKAAGMLHDKFGYGRINVKKGEDPFDTGEASPEELEEFIGTVEKQILELEQPKEVEPEEFDKTKEEF